MKLDIKSAKSLNDANPTPGIYDGVAFERYTKSAGLSNSAIGVYLEQGSFRAMKHFMDHGRPASMAARFGTLAHLALLEPEYLKRNVIFGGPVNEKTGKEFGRGTKAWQEYEEENKGKIMLALEDRDALRAIYKNIRAHPIARRLLLQHEALREASIYWEAEYHEMDGRTGGVLMRGRPDVVIPDERLVVDLKTTERSLSPTMLTKQWVNYGYYRQGPLYCDGMRALTGEKWDCKWILCQSRPPYQVVAVEMREADETVGRGEYKDMLRPYAECLRRGHWLAAAEEFDPQSGRVMTGYMVAELPAWKRGEFAEGR